MAEMRVPLLDLKTQTETIREPLLRAVEETLLGGQWILASANKPLEPEQARRENHDRKCNLILLPQDCLFR